KPVASDKCGTVGDAAHIVDIALRTGFLAGRGHEARVKHAAVERAEMEFANDNGRVERVVAGITGAVDPGLVDIETDDVAHVTGGLDHGAGRARKPAAEIELMGRVAFEHAVNRVEIPQGEGANEFLKVRRTRRI